MQFEMLEVNSDVQLRVGLALCDEEPVQTIVIANGRGEFIEKYTEVIGELNALGLDVWTLDWRGQGLSSRLTTNPQMGFVASFDDYISDLDLMMKGVVLERLRTRNPPILLGHSMGGNIAMRYVAAHRDVFGLAVVVFFSSPCAVPRC